MLPAEARAQVETRPGRPRALGGRARSESGRLAQRVDLVRLLPGELVVLAAEVAVGGGLLVDRPVKLELLAERARTEVEGLVDGVEDLRLLDLLGAEGLDHHR